MCIRNRLVSLIYKLCIVFVSGWGLFLYSGLPAGLNLSAFKYYTILSNCLVFLFFLFNAFYLIGRISKRGVKGVSVYSVHLYGAVLMGILVTLLIYQFLLAPRNFVMPGTSDALRNNIVHLIVPLMILADWALFSRKGRFTAGDPFYWLGFPLLYFAFAVSAAQLGLTYQGSARYPYYFINIDELGWKQVLINVGLLCLAFLVLGYILFAIDKLLGKFAKTPNKAAGIGSSQDDDTTLVGQRPSKHKAVYHAGDAAAMQPADSVVETEPVPEPPDLIVVEKTSHKKP